MNEIDALFRLIHQISKEVLDEIKKKKEREKEEKKLERNKKARKRYAHLKSIGKLPKYLTREQKLENEIEEQRMIAEYASEHCTCHLGNPPCSFCTRDDED